VTSSADGLPVGGVCYTREFDSVDVRREVEADLKALRKKTSGFHNARQVTGSVLICHFRCLDGNLDLDETA
jgi:hypothetical protein